MKKLSSAFMANKAWHHLTALTVCVGLLAGCVVLSVYPFYTVKDLTFDRGLAGRWAKPGTTNEYWEFASVAEKSYGVTTADAHETNRFNGYLFQLQGNQFLDLCVTNRDDWRLPLHLALLVQRTGDDLKLSALDYGWLGSLLETNPAALRHIVVPEKPLETNGSKMFYLTADTGELQKFLLQHLKNTNAFTSLDEMKRVAQ